MNGPHTAWTGWPTGPMSKGADASHFGVSFRPVRRGACPEAPTELEYFKLRAAQEQTAALQAEDPRAQRAHLEMVQRYQALVRTGEACFRPELRLAWL